MYAGMNVPVMNVLAMNVTAKNFPWMADIGSVNHCSKRAIVW